ncbi:hypothetical protein CHS0354_030185 [Potamilus streckersoni]|uniref:Uncharacterized protein n=1 Tax=Potamilus streckersoni TaxID=2493646 RepID=A0AAE0W243_9BIVA|nr:hypothetical protein CHS0354_030185 [Potamilus streckersoni]
METVTSCIQNTSAGFGRWIQTCLLFEILLCVSTRLVVIVSSQRLLTEYHKVVNISEYETTKITPSFSTTEIAISKRGNNLDFV